MGYKFGRNYILTVQYGITPSVNLNITIQPPFTIDFDIQRHDFASASSGSFRIYNLSAQHRAMLRQDMNRPTGKKLILKIGYGNVLSEVMNATVYQAFSFREGDNFITQIDCFDGGNAYSQAQTAQPFPAGTPQQDVIVSLAKSLGTFGVQYGLVGTFPGVTGRGNSYSGNTLDILYELTNGNFCIDNSKIYCLNANECVGGAKFVIDSSSGLLDTPIRENNIISFEMLLEPRLFLNQNIQLQSSTDPTFNKACKVVSLQHRGTISAAVSGDATTMVRAIEGEYVGVF